MNCGRVESRLSAYLDGELKGCEMLAMKEHFRSCPQCASELQALRLVKLRLSSLNVCEADPSFEDRLLTRVMGTTPDLAGRPLQWKSLVAFGLAASLGTLIWTQLNDKKAVTHRVSNSVATSVKNHEISTQASDPLFGPVPAVAARYEGR